MPDPSGTGAALDTLPSTETRTIWLFAAYGAAMLAVQSLENAINLLYLVANAEPEKKSNASAKRQWTRATQRTWRAFQNGTSGMKLNDAKRGIRAHIDPALYDELSAFIDGPRNQLAHRYLIERVTKVAGTSGMAHMAAATAELIQVTQTANRLSEQVFARSDEIRSAWPETEQPPPDVQEWVESVARMSLMKQFPRKVVDEANAAREKRRREQGEGPPVGE